MTSFFDSAAQEAEDRQLLEHVFDSCRLSDTELTTFHRWIEEDRKITERMRSWLKSVKAEHERSEQDKALLQDVIGDDRLSRGEDEAFCDMQAQIERYVRGKLTDAQRSWLEKVAARLGIVHESAANLHSSGKVPEGLPRAQRLLPWEQEGYVKPTRPSGRST